MITPLDNTVKEVMEFTWPMMFICAMTLASIRIAYLIKHKEEFVLYKDIFHLFLMIYILCLFQIVTFEESTTALDGNNIVPFKEILRYSVGSRLFFKNVIGNIVLFIPYGLFASMYSKTEKPFHAFGLVLFASATVEITQVMIGRVFDIDDIILNISGGMIGYLIYYLINKIGERLPRVFRSNMFLNVLASLLVILLVSYVWTVVA